MTAAPMNGVDHERNRQFAAHVTQSLREDYRLRADETERAVGLYMRRKAGWATPDQAAFEAYRWWAATVDPSVVITREAEQLAHAHRADDSDTHPTRSQPVARDRNDKDADQARTEVVQADLAAIEPAPAMSRDHGERNEFSTAQAKLARQLRLVLDESTTRGSITRGDHASDRTPGQADLEAALRPDTVREHDHGDDMVVIEAAFAGTTITVLRVPGEIGTSSYMFMCESPGGRGAQQSVDVTKIGMVAAGDRTPDPARAGDYEHLGNQVRNHLIGLADAVAESRQAWRDQQARRLEAVQTAPDVGVDSSRARARSPSDRPGDPTGLRPGDVRGPAQHTTDPHGGVLGRPRPHHLRKPPLRTRRLDHLAPRHLPDPSNRHPALLVHPPRHPRGHRAPLDRMAAHPPPRRRRRHDRPRLGPTQRRHHQPPSRSHRHHRLHSHPPPTRTRADQKHRKRDRQPVAGPQELANRIADTATSPAKPRNTSSSRSFKRPNSATTWHRPSSPTSTPNQRMRMTTKEASSRSDSSSSPSTQWHGPPQPPQTQ